MSKLLYKDVTDQIRQKIADKIWTNKLPSETELCAQFKVSRITLRRAIQELCDEGIVTKRQGLGMFIEKDDYDLSHLSVSKLLSNVNRMRTLQIFYGVKPYSHVARTLNMEPDETLVEAQRLCYYNDEPVDFITVWFPEKDCKERFFEDDVGDGFIIPALKRNGINIKRTVVTLEPVVLKEKQPLMHLEKGEAVLHLRRVFFDENQNVIYMSEHVMDGKHSRNILKIQTMHY